MDHEHSKVSTLSILQFPPHGARTKRRTKKNRIPFSLPWAMATVAGGSLLAVYTGLARGSWAFAALLVTLAVGSKLVTLHD